MISNTVDMSTTLNESPKQHDFKFCGMSLISVLPWPIQDKIKIPTFFNKKLTKHAHSSRFSQPPVGYSTLRFRPYVSKVPWHTGPRAFLSQFFPRYGHYCGPNWSSGKDGGSLLWDKRPIDWLDYCCYCHDMGYDTHDQAELLKADLAFLDCLERPHMPTKGDIRVANLYKTMCLSGSILYFKKYTITPPPLPSHWMMDEDEDYDSVIRKHGGNVKLKNYNIAGKEISANTNLMTYDVQVITYKS